MSFSDHKITQFTHRISELADQPSLPADELKARFDSSPEELRVAHNAVCDDADRLEARVEGIVAETFGDTIDKSMLSNELAAELDAKATQTALSEVSADVTAEAAARESGDSALSGQISSLQTTVAQRARVVYGTYTGNGSSRYAVTVGFSPKLVYICCLERAYFYGMLSPMCTRLGGAGAGSSQYASRLTANGFTVSQSENINEDEYNLNRADTQYGYVAIG